MKKTPNKFIHSCRNDYKVLVVEHILKFAPMMNTNQAQHIFGCIRHKVSCLCTRTILRKELHILLAGICPNKKALRNDWCNYLA